MTEPVPNQIGNFEYFQLNRGKFARDMKSIADITGTLLEICFRETSDKAIYLYSAVEIRKLMAKVRTVEKQFFGEQA